MKTVISTLAATVLFLVPTAWTTANAHDTSDMNMSGMASMKSEIMSWGHPGKASAVDRTIRIKAEDSMRFVPAKLTVKTGQTIKFIITNTGKLEHELVLGPVAEQKEHEREMQTMMKSCGTHMKMGGIMQGMMQSCKTHMGHSDPNEVELPPGATKTLIWTFTKPGTYQYGCHEPGHYAAGMFGTIKVIETR